MTRFIRFLIFLGYAIGAGGILYGFFLMDWSELGDYRRGYEFVRLIVDRLNVTLLANGSELSIQTLLQTNSEASHIITDYWPALGVFAVLFLAVGHACSAIAAFGVFIAGRPLYPHKRFGAAFAIIGIFLTVIVNVVIPLFILIQFHNRFLIGENQLVGMGFWVTLFGVIIAGFTGPFVEFMRLFIQHPVNRPAKPQQKPSIFDESEVGRGYFDDPVDNQPKRKKPMAERFNHPYYKPNEQD
jgi:hypothetical protein